MANSFAGMRYRLPRNITSIVADGLLVNEQVLSHRVLRIWASLRATPLM
jgi:hypothetical protein